MDELNSLIEDIIKKKGGTIKDYDELMNKIAYHESGHSMNPKQLQIGGGPGRGLFQFEEGDHKGGITAIKRTYKYLTDNNISVPKWLENANKNKSFNASDVDEYKQKMLFLGNMMQHPKADFSKVWNKEESTEDFWAKYHWAGSKKDYRNRLKSFNTSLKKYNEYKNKPKKFTFEFTDNNKVVIEKPTDKTTIINNKGFELGGNLYQNMYKEKYLNSFNKGGLHSENPYGGIPQGKNGKGGINTVEEGESSFDLDGGKYVFSNKLKL